MNTWTKPAGPPQLRISASGTDFWGEVDVFVFTHSAGTRQIRPPAVLQASPNRRSPMRMAGRSPATGGFGIDVDRVLLIRKLYLPIRNPAVCTVRVVTSFAGFYPVTMRRRVENRARVHATYNCRCFSLALVRPPASAATSESVNLHATLSHSRPLAWWIVMPGTTLPSDRNRGCRSFRRAR